MKLSRTTNSLMLLSGISLALISIQANAATSLPEDTLSQHIYVGIFGGEGVFTTNSITQQGTALYTPPLEVNAQGDGSSNSVGIIGLNVGYKWKEIRKEGSEWSFVPAAELEGYYLKGTQNGPNLVNETDRLDLHTFSVSYPMNTGVLLANAVLNFNHGENTVHPYIGVGVGTAIVSINNATSTQTAPEEPGINHYNSNPDASDWTFAAQSKVGLRFNFAEKTSIFAEYRFLYMAPSDYTFGSTQYAIHIPTTDWNVDLGSMYYNMATLGIQYDV